MNNSTNTTMQVSDQAAESNMNIAKTLELLENIGEMAYLLNYNTNRIEYASPSCYDQTGFTPEEIFQMNFRTDVVGRIHPGDLDNINHRLTAMLENPGVQFTAEYRFMCKNGSYRWKREQTRAKYNQETGEIYILGAVTDISKEKQLEDKITELQQSGSPLISAVHPTVKAKLTPTENTILEQIIEGNSNKAIAQNLHRSVRTVEDHRNHIMHKLGAHNVVELLKAAAGPTVE